jgi:hypothetical protein
LHDGIDFEERGLPAVVIVTEPFVPAARAAAAMAGAPSFPFATVPHGVQRMTREEVAVTALEVVPTVEAILLGYPQPITTVATQAKTFREGGG